MTERNEPARVPEGSQGAGDDPLPNRFNRGTAAGCLGLLCVLTLPAMLALPVEQWHVPGWAVHLMPLVGVALVALGTSLLARVPGAGAPPPADPLHPLTRLGVPPVREQPATNANRLSLTFASVLVLCCLAGYLLAGADMSNSLRVLAGTALTWFAGAMLMVYTMLAARRVVASPGWLWVSMPIRGSLVPQALPFGVIGFVSVVWALFVAAGRGYFWAPIGVGALLLALALAGPILQRLPPRDLQ